MAWCPMCGRYWIVKTGMSVRHGMLGRSSHDVIEPLDIMCPTCEDRTRVRS
jgi:hypothetical protein